METTKSSALHSLSTFLTFCGYNNWLRSSGRANFLSSARYSNCVAGALIAGTILLSGKALAQETWQPTAAGTYTWTNPTSNWSSSTVPNGVSATATLESALAGAQTVDLNGGITLGSLSIGATSGSFKFSVAAGTSGSLTMNSGDSTGGAGATITEIATANGDTISAPIIIADTATTTALTITNASGHQFTLSGGITGTGNLVLDQTGASGFFAANTGTINNIGTVTFDNSASSPGTSSVAVGSNVTEFLNSSSVGATVQINSLVVNSNGTTLENSATSGALKLVGAVSGTGDLTLDNTTSSASVFAATGGTSAINMTGSLINASSGAGAITIGSVVGSAVTGITENSASGLTFNQNNTFNNLITITKGKVTIADSSATVFGDLGDNGSGVGSFSGGISVASTGTFIWTSSATQTISGNITGGGAIVVSAPTYSPAVNLTLSGSNTYSGGTTLSSGSVFISNTSGSALGTGSLTVSAGTTFGGSGTGSLTGYTIGAASPAAATTVQVGSGADMTSDLTLVATNASSIKNSNLEFNLNTTGGSNELNVGGTLLTLSGDTLTLNVTSLGVIADNTPYTLIVGTGGTGAGLGQYAGFTVGVNGVISGISLAITGVGAPAGWYSNSYLELVNNAGGADDIEVVVVPEPSTWAMMLGGLATLVFWQRRRGGNNRE
jgi:fibronectin-binding autotransporter adhesin